MTTTYWLNRKGMRDSVNYGATCPSADTLSLGDSVWSRTVDANGMAIWGTLMTTRASTSGLVVDTWDNRGEKPILLNSIVCEV